MQDLKTLVKLYEEKTKREKFLREERNKAQDAIPYFSEKYHQPEGIEARNKYKALHSEWQDIAKEVEDLVMKLELLNYDFSSKQDERE